MSTNWKTSAVAEANLQGCDTGIVLGTIDAESSGDNRSVSTTGAVGFGQIMVMYHYDAFQYVSQRFNAIIPYSSNTSALQSFILNNENYSMAMAVFVIKQYWLQANQDFNKFTKLYEGPAATDTQRRYNIYVQYAGKNPNSVMSQTSSSNTNSNSNSVNGTLAIPETNFGVVGTGSQPSNILFGRRYRVIVSNKNGVGLDVSKLRCTFNIQKTMQMQANYSTVTIYNLSAQSENKLITEGNRVVIEAGYEGEQYGCIYDGTVIQPIRDKQDGVNYLLTLSCLDADGFLNGGLINFSVAKGQIHRDVVTNIVSNAAVPTDTNFISKSLGNTKLLRGKVCFGLAKDYLRQIAISNNGTFYTEDNKVNIIQLTDLPNNEIIELSPTSGLIGVPTQTEYGVSFKCLINPRIKINSLVHIDNSLIHDMQTQIGQVVRSLDNSGIYRIIKINHTGDTRGDDWFTQCESVSQAGLAPNMLSNTGNGF